MTVGTVQLPAAKDVRDMLTGLECLQALRSAGSAVPFGFVTSEGSAEMRDKASAAGALFLIAKPFNEETFRENLDG